MNKFLENYKAILNIFLLLFISSFAIQNINAQVSGTVSSVNFGDAKEGSDLTVNVELYSVSSISNITFAYQPYGANEFKLRDMELRGTVLRTQSRLKM